MYRDKENELMRYLQLEGVLKMSDVVNRLQVSESTARRMFLKLEEEGRALRIHGGIRYASPAFQDYSFDQLVKENILEKKSIAALAVEQLKDGDVVFCDSGTTLSCFCMELVHSMEKHKLDLKFYTNSLANFEILVSKVPVTLIGGEFRNDRQDFYGYLAESVLEKLHFTKCLMGADGYSESKECFTATDFATAKLNEIAAANSKEVMILCSSDKFFKQAHVSYIGLSSVDKVITDDSVDEEIRQSLENRGVQVLTGKVER
ncbi:MAG: DeoR/GlpR transcriptional regulator [Lachnospiraceae bacterium]|nr:DeoR/GlpR transcriptional regulator [Lachnospiraceae bacterium]